MGDDVKVRLLLEYEGDNSLKRLANEIAAIQKSFKGLRVPVSRASGELTKLASKVEQLAAAKRAALNLKKVAGEADRLARAGIASSGSIAKLKTELSQIARYDKIVSSLSSRFSAASAVIARVAGSSKVLSGALSAVSSRILGAGSAIGKMVRSGVLVATISSRMGTLAKAVSAVAAVSGKASNVFSALRGAAKSALAGVKGTASKAASAISRVRKALNSASGAFDRSARSASLFKKALRLAGAAVGIFSVGFAIRAMARQFANMIKIGAQFQSTMAEVAAILGNVGAIGTRTFDRLEKAALRLGRTTVFTARQVAKAQVNMARAGLTADEILGALDDTINLAAVGNLQMAEAADIAVAAIRALGQTTAEFTDTVNVMTFAAVNSNQTVGDFGQAMRFAAPAAAVASVSIQDLAFSFSLMANAGIKGQKAGAAVRKTFATLFAELNKVGQFEGKLAGLGKELFEIDAATGESKFIGLANALEIMQKKGFTATKAFDVFGVRAGNFFALLAKQGPASIRKFHEELKTAGDIANEIRIKKIDTLIGDTILLNSAWEGFSQVVSTAATPALRALATGLTNILNLTTDTANANEDAASQFSLTIRTVQLLSRVIIFFSAIFANSFNNLSLITEKWARDFWGNVTATISVFGLLLKAAGTTAAGIARFFKMGGLADSIDAQVEAGVGSLLLLAKQTATKADENQKIIDKENELLADKMAWLSGVNREVDNLSDTHKNFAKNQRRTNEEIEELNENLVAIQKGWTEYKTKMEAVGITQDQFARGVTDMEGSLKKFGATILPTVVRAVDRYDEMLEVAREMGKEDIIKASSVAMLRKIVTGLQAAGVAAREYADVSERLSDAEAAELDVRLNTSSLETIKTQAQKTFAGLGLDFMNTEKAQEQLRLVGLAWQHQKELIEGGVAVPELETTQLRNSLNSVVRDLKEKLGPEEFSKLNIPPVLLTAEITGVEVRTDVFAEFNARMKGLGADIRIDPSMTIASAQRDVQALEAALQELEDQRIHLPTEEFHQQMQALVAEYTRLFDFIDSETYERFIMISPEFDYTRAMVGQRKLLAMENDLRMQRLQAEKASATSALQVFDGTIQERLSLLQTAHDADLEMLNVKLNEELAARTLAGENFFSVAAELAQRSTDLEDAQRRIREGFVKEEAVTKKESLAQTASNFAKAGSEIFGQNKALAIAGAIADTYAAVVRTMKDTPGEFAAKAAAGAAMAALGLANIIKIKKAKPTKQIFGGIAAGPDFGVDSQLSVRRPGEATLPKSLTDFLVKAGANVTETAPLATENSPDAARRGAIGPPGGTTEIIMNINLQALDERGVREFFEDNNEGLAAGIRLALEEGNF